MTSISKPRRAAAPPLSKKSSIFWECGVEFGGVVALIPAFVEVSMHRERYYPLASSSAFSWFWMLVVHPLMYFGVGCLYGLIVWKMYGRRSQVERDE